MTTAASSQVEAIASKNDVSKDKVSKNKATKNNVLDITELPTSSRLRDLQFELTHKLQSSLEIKSTLEEFFNKIQGVITVDGLEYYFPDDNKQLQHGEIAQHKASYAIHVENGNLGDITFSRSIPFMEAELAILEMLIGTLCYPLRNALMYQRALQSSLRDALTGIGNRAAMTTCLERELKLSQRHQQSFSILIVDIDFFKRINDSYGHSTGDEVLKSVAETLQLELRETDQIFRFGGEEFVALLNNTNLANAHITAERLRKRIACTPVPANSTIEVTISIGISEAGDNDTPESLFQRADEALYTAKHKGRNRVEAASVSLTSDNALTV